MRAEEFLRQYRVLEGLLEARYEPSERRHSSVVIDFIDDAVSAPYRDRLNVYREVRNLLTHNADGNGNPVVEPTEETLSGLNQVIEYVKRPPMALDFATGAQNVLFARLEQGALGVMRAMDERGFSHVPVIERGCLRGVFSVSTVFAYVRRRPGARIDENTRVSDFAEYLPIDRHPSERFGFIDGKATFFDVKKEFEHKPKRLLRLAALFVTENGTENSQMLGMITPWDVLGKPIGAR